MPRYKSGTPKLTSELVEKIASYLRQGVGREEACAHVGITSRTLRNWLTRAADGGPRSGKYRRFAEALEQAEGEAATRFVLYMRKAAEKDWRAAAWLLSHTGSRAYTRHRGAGKEPPREAGETLSEILARDFPQEVKPFNER